MNVQIVSLVYLNDSKDILILTFLVSLVNFESAYTFCVGTLHKWVKSFMKLLNNIYCQDNRFIESGRFDLTDGPNATRTSEYAEIEKLNDRYLLVNVHWDHESVVTRMANAKETSIQLNQIKKYQKWFY